MKILTFSWFYPPFIGGAENIAKEGVIGLAARGHQITVLTCAAPNDEDSITNESVNLEIVRMACLHPQHNDEQFKEELAYKVNALLSRKSFDLIHSHLLTYPWAPARSNTLLRAFKGLPIVDQAHGGDFEDKSSTCLRLMSFVNHIIADSYDVKKRLEKLKNSESEYLNFPEITVLHPSILDSYNFRPNPELRSRVRRELGISDDKFLVFYPSRFFDIDGNFSERKRPLTALKAYAQLCQLGNSNSSLLAILPPGFWTKESEMPARKRIKNLLDEQKIGNKVILLNKGVEHKDMASYFNAADVTLVPSVEGFGLVYLESIACGVPVVGIAAGAAVEVVTHESGILVEPSPNLEQSLAKALWSLEENISLRQAMGSAGGSIFLQKYDKAKWIKELEDILLKQKGV